MKIETIVSCNNNSDFDQVFVKVADLIKDNYEVVTVQQLNPGLKVVLLKKSQ